MNTKGIFTLSAACLMLFLSSSYVNAGTITKPHTFSPDTLIRSQDFNENFDTVYDQVNRIGSAITVRENDSLVGIGTDEPASRLDVNGSIRATELCDEAGENCKDISSGWASATADSHSLNSADESVADAVYVDNTGNVGVGTTNPQRKLHISDAMRLEPINDAPSTAASGDMYFDISDALCVYMAAGWSKLAGTGYCGSAPIANAGDDQSVSEGSLVVLDGSGSSDADNDSLTYSWTITDKPSGSTASLSNDSIINPTFTTDLVGNYTVSLVVNDGNEDSAEDTVILTATFATVTSAGQIWMDRNLGASRVATSLTDSAAYGDLYQWGRGTDGHEKRTSGTTTTLSNSDNPGHGYFIRTFGYPYHDDWRSPQNNNLWQGVNGINNPCPVGYRLPTYTELQTERASWSSDNSTGAFNSPLKLVVAGYRGHSSGTLYSAGSYGFYWSSTVYGVNARYLDIYSSDASIDSISIRSRSVSVRCIKD